MIKLKSVQIRILTILLILLTNCKSEIRKEQKTRPYISKVTLKENISDFTSKMTKKDTIKIIVNLKMEWWIRKDELILTKKNNEIYLQVTIIEDTTFEGKYQMRKNMLPDIIIANSDNNFEKHFSNKNEKTKIDESKTWFYKIINQKDTLTLFIKSNLGAIGGEVGDYFKFMKNYYPKEKEFQPFDEPKNIEELKNVE